MAFVVTLETLSNETSGIRITGSTSVTHFTNITSSTLEVQRSTDGTSFTTIHTITTGTTPTVSYLDTNVSTGVEYYYRLYWYGTAWYDGGDFPVTDNYDELSNTSSIVREVIDPDLVINDLSTDTLVGNQDEHSKISYISTIPPSATSYEYQWSTSNNPGGVWNTLGTSSPSSNILLDSGSAPRGVRFYIRILANGQSSNIVGATLPPLPPSLTNVSFTDTLFSSTEGSWDLVEGYKYYVDSVLGNRVLDVNKASYIASAGTYTFTVSACLVGSGGDILKGPSVSTSGTIVEKPPLPVYPPIRTSLYLGDGVAGKQMTMARSSEGYTLAQMSGVRLASHTFHSNDNYVLCLDNFTISGTTNGSNKYFLLDSALRSYLDSGYCFFVSAFYNDEISRGVDFTYYKSDDYYLGSVGSEHTLTGAWFSDTIGGDGSPYYSSSNRYLVLDSDVISITVYILNITKSGGYVKPNPGGEIKLSATDFKVGGLDLDSSKLLVNLGKTTNGDVIRALNYDDDIIAFDGGLNGGYQAIGDSACVQVLNTAGLSGWKFDMENGIISRGTNSYWWHSGYGETRVNYEGQYYSGIITGAYQTVTFGTGDILGYARRYTGSVSSAVTGFSMNLGSVSSDTLFGIIVTPRDDASNETITTEGNGSVDGIDAGSDTGNIIWTSAGMGPMVFRYKYDWLGSPVDEFGNDPYGPGGTGEPFMRPTSLYDTRYYVSISGGVLTLKAVCSYHVEVFGEDWDGLVQQRYIPKISIRVIKMR